jgi:hypothetical protein
MSGILQLSRSALHQGTFPSSWTPVPRISGLDLRTVNLQRGTAAVYVVYVIIPDYNLTLTFIPQGNHQFLGVEFSSTFKSSNSQFHVEYGTGSVTGNIVQDNIVIAGLPLKGHIFGAAFNESDDFTGDTSFDGLMGLAQSVR